MSELSIARFHGPGVEDHLRAIADLRMRVFRDWPYLYDGDEQTERDYLQIYLNSVRSFVLLVFDGDDLVGMTSAMPLADEDLRIQAPFHENGFDVQRVFYFPEAILLPAYRGRGLYRRFFHEREDHARSFGEYDWVTLCTVDRPRDHPAQPTDYQPLDPIWQRFGFERRADIATTFAWLDVGDEAETTKPLVYWLKSLADAPVRMSSLNRQAEPAWR